MPLTDPITEEEEHLLESFRALGVKPKADTKEELKRWLEAYAAAAGGTAAPTVTPPETKITVSSQTPRISIFYGDVDTLTKGEVVYDQWKYEVISLVKSKTYKEDVVLQAVRRSLKGEALRILMRLGTDPSVDHILHKFESVYGVIDTRESILSDFYAARQLEKEDVTTWSCRLEDLLGKAIEKGLVPPTEINDMLKGMLWKGLRVDLKDICGYKFERIHDFDRLRVELRKIETDHYGDQKKGSTRGVSKGVVQSKDMEMKKEVDDLKQVVASMSENMTLMNDQLKAITAQQQLIRNNWQGYNNQPHNPQKGQQQQQGARFKGNKGRGKKQKTKENPNATNTDTQPEPSKGDVTCYVCGQKGHMKWQCRQNTDVTCYRCHQPGHYQWQCNLRQDYLNQ